VSDDLDPRDYSRRTLLANERTFLAWWRTGLTAITAGLAAAQVVPKLSGSTNQWAYTTLGAVLAALGVVALAYGDHRRRAVIRALERGEFDNPSTLVTSVMTGAGVLTGLGLIVLIVLGG
jgi:putative membrane protein